MSARQKRPPGAKRKSWWGESFSFTNASAAFRNASAAGALPTQLLEVSSCRRLCGSKHLQLQRRHRGYGPGALPSPAPVGTQRAPSSSVLACPRSPGCKHPLWLRPPTSRGTEEKSARGARCALPSLEASPDFCFIQWKQLMSIKQPHSLSRARHGGRRGFTAGFLSLASAFLACCSLLTLSSSGLSLGGVGGFERGAGET